MSAKMMVVSIDQAIRHALEQHCLSGKWTTGPNTFVMAATIGVMDVIEAADKARGGEEAAEMGGWQPIETAPKDGSAILIYGGTYSYSIYADEPFDGISIARWYRCHWRGEDRQAHDDWYSHKPTHWRPLPKPPQPSKGCGDD